MKKPLQSITLILAAIAFALIPVSCTDDEHDHDHDHDHAHADGHDHAHAEGEEHDHGHEHGGIEDGPNGGRLLTTVEPHLEFFVTDDRKVQITSIDEEEKAQPIGEQVVKVIGGSRSNPIRLSLLSRVMFSCPTLLFLKATTSPSSSKSRTRQMAKR